VALILLMRDILFKKNLTKSSFLSNKNKVPHYFDSSKK